MKTKITVYSLKNTQRKGEEVSHKGNRVNRGFLITWRLHAVPLFTLCEKEPLRLCVTKKPSVYSV